MQMSSWKFLTTISVVSVSTMLLFLTKKKYITDFSKSIRVGRMSTSICVAAAIIGGNDDLVAQILVLLPTKTVVRFKSVSKQWLSLISSEFFARLHAQNHVRRCVESRDPFIMSDVHGRAELFICHHTIKKLFRVSMPSPIKEEPFKYFEILQSWNGLLLISMKFLEEDRIDYVVFNPTTKHYRLLQLDGYRPLYICLMFDPSKPECYKVVMVTGLTPLMKYSVYDPATQEWSHDFEGGEPFTKGDALGFRISDAQLLNLRNKSKIQGFDYLKDTTAGDFCSVQLEPFPEENKLRFRIREWIHDEWAFDETRTVKFKNSSTGVRLLAIMLEDGAKIKDVEVLFHVPGQLLIYKISQGIKVLVDYKRDEWQFEHAHRFINTFAPV